MSAIIILLLASISVAALFLAAFIWSVKSGQYDDEFSPPQRILFENTEVRSQKPEEEGKKGRIKEWENRQT
jgi:cbb3-type cytochrome oxidase maturation protein